jgi:hypothetical protein
MSAIHLLLPFALPSATDAQTVLQGLALPALTRIAARARLVGRTRGEDYQRSLPHQRWLAQTFDAADADSVDDAPLAPYMLLADGGQPGDVRWACVEPVHIQIAQDHLVLVEPHALGLDDAEAAALLATARESVDEAGLTLFAPTPRRWYLSGAALGVLSAAPPERAAGRNVEIWLPHETVSGERSRTWMKLQNEIQMAWFDHPVNAAREEQGRLAVNSIWLHAQGVLRPVTSPFSRVYSDAVATRGLAIASATPYMDAPVEFATLDPRIAGNGMLVELPSLGPAFVQQDWHAWRERMSQIESVWFAPALAAVQDGRLDRLLLTFGGEAGTVTLSLTRADLLRFWRRQPLPAVLFD